GLLLGGVLKGQELIEQSKIKRVINDLNGLSAAYYSYQDRYRYAPGDDPNAAGRWPTQIGGTAAAANGDGDGLIGGNANNAFVASATESGYTWQHLRLAGFVTGEVRTAALSYTSNSNAFDGRLGIGYNAYALSANAVCASVPVKAAEQVDTQLDDRVPNTGLVRAAATAALNTAPTAANSANGAYVVASPEVPWTVCKKL
ncbi:MAG: prepilin-type cleavage/methylation domain-containing protein, partial [Gallionellaceae bacterium]|nr:prepilin-type cleavage/methylation domain-containing protein [Gallionellaceae bacterium]